MKLARHKLIAFALFLILAVAGCGGSDTPSGPTQPPGPKPPDDFDETTAISNAQVAYPQAVSLVQSMQTLANGFGSFADAFSTANEDTCIYAWSEENERWEMDCTFASDGCASTWHYTDQYIDSLGQAVQFPTPKSTMHYTYDAAGHCSSSQEGTTYTYDYVWHENMLVSGLLSNALHMSGDGAWDIDSHYSGQGYNYIYTYNVEWEILPPGIDWTDDGCPTGTIRYLFLPYRMDIVFDGTATVTATLYDAGGSVVEQWTDQLDCP